MAYSGKIESTSAFPEHFTARMHVLKLRVCLDCERPRIQTLLTRLTTLEMNSSEPISDYLARSEML